MGSPTQSGGQENLDEIIRRIHELAANPNSAQPAPEIQPARPIPPVAPRVVAQPAAGQLPATPAPQAPVEGAPAAASIARTPAMANYRNSIPQVRGQDPDLAPKAPAPTTCKFGEITKDRDQPFIPMAPTRSKVPD